MISCTLKEKYIRLISSKQKVKEARMANPMFNHWKVGDEVKFFSKRNPSMYVIVKITKKNHYVSVYNMLSTEGVETLVPNVRDINAGVRLYMALPNYKELEKKYGVLAFHFSLLTPHDPNKDWNASYKRDSAIVGSGNRYGLVEQN